MNELTKWYDFKLNLIGLCHYHTTFRRKEVVTSEQIENTGRLENKWVDYYEALCTRCNCNTKFEIEEREDHYKFWTWKIIN